MSSVASKNRRHIHDDESDTVSEYRTEFWHLRKMIITGELYWEDCWELPTFKEFLILRKKTTFRLSENKGRQEKK